MHNVAKKCFQNNGEVPVKIFFFQITQLQTNIDYQMLFNVYYFGQFIKYIFYKYLVHYF